MSGQSTVAELSLSLTLVDESRELGRLSARDAKLSRCVSHATCVSPAIESLCRWIVDASENSKEGGRKSCQINSGTRLSQGKHRY